MLASKALVVDACRHAVRDPRRRGSRSPDGRCCSRSRARSAEAWPNDVPRGTLVARAFRGKQADESHRARLRVEVGASAPNAADAGRRDARPRRDLRWCRAASATSSCWRDRSKKSMRRCWPFLADGESWSSSALALALGASQRTVQRALEELAAAGKVQSFGRGRARRWMTPPVPGFATALLLPAPLPSEY